MWVGFTRENKAAPRLVIEGRRSDSNRYRGSGDPEPGALFFPCDRQARVAHKLLRGRLERMAVPEDGPHDLRREEAEPQDPGEVGPTEALSCMDAPCNTGGVHT